LQIARSLAGRLPVSDDKISFEYKLKRFLAGCAMDPYRAHVYWNGTSSDAEKSAVTRSPLPPALAGLLEGAAHRGSGLNALLRFDQSCFLPDDILMKVDRMSMAHSLEVRPPFLDHRIVEFAASLPPHCKTSGSRQKIVLKQLMKDKLPGVVLRRPKMGLDFPAHDWLRGALREFLLDTFATAESAYADFFNFPLINSFVSDHLNRRANLGYHLWGFLNLFLWMNRWKIQCALSAQSSLKSADHLLTSI
jgi:asparagine synthase (glutamine-hydrolysing)